MAEIKLRIRELRQQRGMTLADLAGQVGMSIPHLSDLETGKKRFNATNLAALAEALEVTPSALFDEGEESIQGRINRLPPEDFNLIMRMLEALERAGPEE
jgi:transcriptional regulator with XRE-family HTH domain